MNTIARLFGKRASLKPHGFGVEIELEGIDKRVRNIPLWHDEFDGSLRDNGREFIFDGVYDLDDSKKALLQLKDAFKVAGLKPKATNLTSTHIHIDVRNFNVVQLKSFVAAIMMVEHDLALNSGQDRDNNYFALSTSVSDHRKRELVKVRTDEQFKEFIIEQVRRDHRYSGINFNSIHEHGSLEMRYLGGQANPLNVMPWLVFYANLKDLVLKGIDFDALFASVSLRGTKEVEEVFKPPFPLTQGGLLEGIRNAQDFVYSLEYRVLTAEENGNGLAEYFNKN